MRNVDSYCLRVGSLNVETVTGNGRGLGGYDGNEKCLFVVCVKPGVHTRDYACLRSD